VTLIVSARFQVSGIRFQVLEIVIQWLQLHTNEHQKPLAIAGMKDEPAETTRATLPDA
jgi:hypothetical protein